MVIDELPAEALIPDYTIGCKRILISNDWYPTLLQPHVKVVTDPVERVTPDGVVAGGRASTRSTRSSSAPASRRTGFLAPDADHRARRASTSTTSGRTAPRPTSGITVSGFPNLFVLYGPNTNLGHNSIIFMLERQIRYALDLHPALAEHGRSPGST